MKKNRKRAETYRFNGHPYFHAGSIHPVTMADLESRIKRFEDKLVDPNDPDDKNWTARWLRRFRKELEKKRTGRGLKQRDKRVRRRMKARTHQGSQDSSDATSPTLSCRPASPADPPRGDGWKP